MDELQKWINACQAAEKENDALRELLERCKSKIKYAVIEENKTHSVQYKESLNELYRDIIAALEEK